MQSHTYSIIVRGRGETLVVAGRRRIIAEFVRKVCRDIENRDRGFSMLVVGTGANIQMLAQVRRCPKESTIHMKPRLLPRACLAKVKQARQSVSL